MPRRQKGEGSAARHEAWMRDLDAVRSGELPVMVEDGCICTTCNRVGCPLCSQAGCSMHWRPDTIYPHPNWRRHA